MSPYIIISASRLISDWRIDKKIHHNLWTPTPAFHSLKWKLDLNVKLISFWSVKYGLASSIWLRGITELEGEKRWWLEHSKAVITCMEHKAEVPTSCLFKNLQYHPCPINAADLRSYLIHLITPLQNICIQYSIPWSSVSFMTKTQGPVLKLQGGNNFHLFHNRSLKSLWTHSLSLSVCLWPPLADDSWPRPSSPSPALLSSSSPLLRDFSVY